MKTLQLDVTIKYGHRFVFFLFLFFEMAQKEIGWFVTEAPQLGLHGSEFQTPASLQLHVSAAGNKYK